MAGVIMGIGNMTGLRIADRKRNALASRSLPNTRREFGNLRQSCGDRHASLAMTSFYQQFQDLSA
jgi:hypothetical protein